MNNLLDITQFYKETKSAILNRCMHIGRKIIREQSIERKIELGLTLGPLLEMAGRVAGRLEEVAAPAVLGRDSPEANIRSDLTLTEIANRADELQRSLHNAVLSGPDSFVVGLVAQHSRLYDDDGTQSTSEDLPRRPRRDPTLKRSTEKPFRFHAGESIIANHSNYLGFLFYVLVDVEISAMEVCSYMALRSPQMPTEFAFDMARQIWDETRHAAYIYDLYKKLGGSYGSHPYTNTIVDRFHAATNLLDGLIVQQVLQESNAVENNIALARELSAAGRHEEANGFIAINNDEALHARIGFRWIAYLAEKNGWPSDFLFARTLHMCKGVGLPLFGMGTWSDIVREGIGTPQWLMHKKTFFGDESNQQDRALAAMRYR